MFTSRHGVTSQKPWIFISLIANELLIYAWLCSECGPSSVVGIATGYGLDSPGIESRWGPDFPHPSRPALGAHPTSCRMGTGSFPEAKSDQGVTLTPHPLLVPWSWKSRAIRLLPLWAVRPVQSVSACTRVHFTFTFMFSVRKCVSWSDLPHPNRKLREIKSN